jgi:ABC transporter transmembrane region
VFALITPLFFQVVTDKVLTHRGFTTLDVLVVGLVAVSIFETVLGALRTYVFSHTTNRIDVELGARLYRHLIALPVAYFEARRAGDSVARVRELENIRNFLTSSALTLVIDLGFTFVFLAVMYYYSPLLSWIVVGSFPFYIAISAGVTPVFRRRLEKKSGLYRVSSYCISLLLLLASWSAAYGQASPWDRRDEYRQADYAELTGADAARFLVGNSVILPEEKEGGTVAYQRRVYYFLDDRTVYQCTRTSEGSCQVGVWSVSENGICFGVDLCAKPFAVFRSPSWQEWGRRDGRLGIYLTHNHFAYKVVKGNWTGAPLFDVRVSGSAIELNRAEYADEAAEAVRSNLPPGQLRISGARALSLLIGSTFLSKDVQGGLKEGSVELCPEQGLYYSPEGFVLSFSCSRQSHSWSMDITRWRIVSGLLCGNDADHIQQFDCKGAVVTAVPVPQGTGTSGKMSVLNYEGGEPVENALTGYAGNIFNFRFGGRDK